MISFHPLRLKLHFLLFALLFLAPLLLGSPAVLHAGWVRQTSNTTLQLNDVCFVDSLYGWTVGGRWAWPDTTFLVALRTTDGGTSWLKSWEAFGLGQLKTVTFVSRLHGWAMADSALTVESTDGGGRSGVWEDSHGRFQPPTSNLHLSVVPNPFVSFASVPGHASERFSLYDVSGCRVGTYKGDRVGEGLSAGVYFLRPFGGNAKPLRIVNLR